MIQNLWHTARFVFIMSFFLSGTTWAKQPLVLKGVITGDDVRIRRAPGLKAPRIGLLHAGMEVKILGETSGQAVGGDKRWYQIQDRIHQNAHVHSSFVKTGQQAREWQKSLPKELHHDRLISVFGPKQANEILRYQRSFLAIQSSADLAAAYRLAETIRSPLSERLQQVFTQLQDKYGVGCEVPITWSDKFSPGLTKVLAAECSAVFLAQDRATWARAAKLTKDRDDDEFIDLLVMAYRPDDLHTWFGQTGDGVGYSLLGKDIHLNILKRIDSLEPEKHRFKAEMKLVRTAVMGDILYSGMYGQKGQYLAAELKRILAQVNLNKEERQKIKDRLQVFIKGGPGIQLNCIEAQCSY